MKKTLNTFADLKIEERETRKKYFIEAAWRQLQIKDSDQITMKDIAKDLNVSIPSVYTYFDNKDALFFELLRRKKDSINDKSENVKEHMQNSTMDETDKLLRYFDEKNNILSLLMYFAEKQNSLTVNQQAELSIMQNDFFKTVKGRIENIKKLKNETSLVY